MKNTLKDLAVGSLMTLSSLTRYTEASAQNIKNTLDTQQSYTERKHRTSEGKKEYEQFFYKGDTLELPEGLSYKEYITRCQTNEQKIRKFLVYADSTLDQVPHHIQARNQVIEDYYNNITLSGKHTDDVIVPLALDLMDILYFDAGNQEIIKEYEKNPGEYMKKYGNIFDRFFQSIKRENNVSFLLGERKVHFLQSSSLHIKRDGKDNEIVCVKGSDWGHIGSGGPSGNLKNFAYLNRADVKENFIQDLISTYKQLFGENFDINNFWLGASFQELAHIYFPGMSENESDFVLVASNADAGKIVFTLRITDFYRTYKNDLDLKTGMGSEYYQGIYDYFKNLCNQFPDGLDGIKDSQDRDTRSQANKKHLKNALKTYFKDAKEFVEKN